MSFASYERKELAKLLRDVGPEYPTLCEGWTTHDLIAHLVVREQRPLAAAGLVLPPLQHYLQRTQTNTRKREYHQLIDAWVNFKGRRVADALINGAENFVHHEDVRRGRGVIAPRTFSTKRTSDLLQILRQTAPMQLRRSTGPVVLQPIGGGQRFTAHSNPRVAAKGAEVATVTGAPGELLLWVFGRDAVQVEVEDPQGFVVRSSI